jgi:hypothetical protein
VSADAATIVALSTTASTIALLVFALGRIFRWLCQVPSHSLRSWDSVSSANWLDISVLLTRWDMYLQLFPQSFYSALHHLRRFLHFFSLEKR